MNAPVMMLRQCNSVPFAATKELGYVTIRPHNEEEEWGDKVFKSGAKHGLGYAEYLKKKFFFRKRT